VFERFPRDQARATTSVELFGTDRRSADPRLSMTMIKRLRDRFDVPADLLISATPRKRTAA
jgi:hypothetical protein